MLHARDDGRPAVRTLFGSLLEIGDLSLDFAVILDGSEVNHLDKLADVVGLRKGLAEDVDLNIRTQRGM